MSAGWPRFTGGSRAGQAHSQWPGINSNLTTTSSKGCSSSPAGGAGDCGSSGPRISSSKDATDAGHPPVKGDSGTVVEYRLHEFGLLSPLQGFTHWPGFSLNPALWDLARLDANYRRRYGRQFKFDPTDIRSEWLARPEESSFHGDHGRTLRQECSSRPYSFAVLGMQNCMYVCLEM